MYRKAILQKVIFRGFKNLLAIIFLSLCIPCSGGHGKGANLTQSRRAWKIVIIKKKWTKIFLKLSFFFFFFQMHSINNMYNSIVWSVGFMAYDNGVIRVTKFSGGKNSCNHCSQAIHTSSGSFSLFCSPRYSSYQNCQDTLAPDRHNL